MPDVAYCGEAIQHWQVMDCAPSHLLSADVQARRAVTFRVTRDTSRRVALVEAINGFGVLVEIGTEDVASWAYTYAGDEDVPTEIAMKDRHGKAVGFARLSEGGAKLEWLDSAKQPWRRKATTYTASRLTYDARGGELRTRFFNARGAPVRDEDGVYGYDYAFTEEGFISGWTAIGVDGQPSVQNRWSTIVEIVRDATGRRTGRRAKDASGAPVLESNGSAGYDQELDADGNLVRQTNLGVDGRPAPDEKGVAITTIDRDAHGESIRLRFLDAAGKPAPAKQGNGGWNTTIDERGHVVSFDVVDTRGALMVGAGGFARKVSVFDAEDRVIEERFLDVAGAPTTTKAGISSVVTAYDDRGNVSETRNFDRKGRLVLSKEGWAIRRCGYDDHDRLVDCSTFDAARRPAITREGWFSRVVNVYDAWGDVVESRWTAEGASGPPRVHGGSKRVIGRDALGSITSDAYFDEKGAPVARAIGGFARLELQTDDSGSTTKSTYFAADGAVGKITTLELDPHGWATSEEETGPGGAPATPVFRTVYTRDARGLVVGIAYFDGAGAPVALRDGIAKVERGYDAYGRMARERHLGVDGKPLAGAAGLERTYDTYGRQTSETWVDGSGAPASSAASWATKRTTYDIYGNVVEYRWLDRAGALVAPSGFAIERFERDRFGGVAAYRVFGVDERPMQLPGQKSYGWRVEIDDRGNTILSIRLDENRKAQSGFLLVSRRYDEHDALAEIRFVDADDRPGTNVDGFSIVRIDNDDRGQRLRDRYFDANGQRVATLDGVAERRFTYDEPTGKRIDELCIGAEGQPVDNAEGWSRRHDEWLEDGTSKTTYFSAAGAEVTPKKPTAPAPP